MRYYSLTDIGLIRKINQDSYLCVLNHNKDLLVLVCDGIGGGKAGEVASSEALEYISQEFKNNNGFKNEVDARKYLNKLIFKANRHVYDLAQKNINYYGMGTTITGLLLTKNFILSLNVGDSRVYGLKDDELLALTDDHTLVNEMLKRGDISYVESLNHPKRHYLTKALGIHDFIDIDIKTIDDEYSYFLICSDGLHGYVSYLKIKNILKEDDDIKTKCKNLLNAALLEGGYDNITIVLVER